MATRRDAAKMPPPPPPDDTPPHPPEGASQGTRPTRPTRPASESKGTKSRTRTPDLQKRLEELFSLPALMYSWNGDTYPVAIINQRAPAMAEAWYDLANQNPAVKRVLQRITEGGAWGGVILSSAAMVLPLLQYHGMIPGADPFAAFYPGVEAPERGPIVPPPPSPEGPQETPIPRGGSENGGGGGYTPPVSPDAPPGVVTVAALQARGADRSVERAD